MKSFIISLLLCVLSIQIGVSQSSLNDSNYVVVPDQFEFLSGEDLYQVNSLTVWLLKKSGFNAYLDSQLPLYLRKMPCKGLKAVVSANENMIRTKTRIVFTDCMGNVVYTSDEGQSKEKDYRKSYHESIRESFISIESLNVKQQPLAEVNELVNDTDSIVVPLVIEQAITETETVVTPVGSNNTNAKVLETVAVVATVDKEITTPLQFKEYSLTPHQKGYDVMYKGTFIGTIKPTSNTSVYLVNTSQFSGVGYAADQGFVIEREVEGMDQIIKMTFTRK